MPCASPVQLQLHARFALNLCTTTFLSSIDADLAALTQIQEQSSAETVLNFKRWLI
ncbi:hypothetical protein P3T43_007230 [Paraburkholderia sp. GAS41]|jgi:hypothetical protein